MAFNFPDSPTVDQTYQHYVWDGQKWTWTATAGGEPPPADPLGTMDLSVAGNPLVVVVEDF